MSTNKLESNLNHLLKRNYDAEKGYQEVAEKMDHPQIKKVLQENARNRYQFGHDLKAIMKDLNISPDKGTSAEGDAHRAWINFRDSFSLNSKKAVLNEAERGEETAIKDYRDAIEGVDMQTGHREILKSHITKIERSKRDISKLKDNM